MRIMNLIRWSIIAVLFSAFISIDAEPVNASTGSASNGASFTQNDKPQKHRNRKQHRRHRKHRRHHHRRMMDKDKNLDKKVPPKNENK